MRWRVNFSDNVDLKFDANKTLFCACEKLAGSFCVQYMHNAAKSNTLTLRDPGWFKKVDEISNFAGRCFVALYHIVHLLFPEVTQFEYSNSAGNDELTFSEKILLEDAWETNNLEAVLKIGREKTWRSRYYERVGFFNTGTTVNEKLYHMANIFLKEEPCDTDLVCFNGPDWTFSGNIMQVAPYYAKQNQWIVSVDQE